MPPLSTGLLGVCNGPGPVLFVPTHLQAHQVLLAPGLPHSSSPVGRAPLPKPLNRTPRVGCSLFLV